MSFKSFLKKIGNFFVPEHKECCCHTTTVEEPKNKESKDSFEEKKIEEKSKCCLDESCGSIYHHEIKEEPTTIEKIAESIKETKFEIHKTTVIEDDKKIITIKDGDVEISPKVTAKEIKEKVKRPKKIVENKAEEPIKKKPSTPRKKSPPKNENPL